MTKAPYPYLSQKFPTAYPMGDGLYKIRGKTYHCRDKLKAHGARWNPEHKHWIGSLEAAESIGALIMSFVRVAAHCHEEERMIWVNHREIEAGCVRMGCGLCDTSAINGNDVKILEVLPNSPNAVREALRAG